MTRTETPEQRAALDRAKRGNKKWFGWCPIEPSGYHNRHHKIVPVHGRVVRR
jgi:hypothetical protein